MFKFKEIAIIIAVSLVLGVALSLIKSLELLLYVTLSAFIIIMINSLVKKATAYYFESEIEVKLWEIKKYGFRSKEHFKRPFPIGVILPILTTAISVGYVVWMACLIFDTKAKVHKAAKRHGLYSFSEMTEFQIGIIAAAGIFINLVIALVAYFIGLPPEMNFVKLSILFTVYNMIPIGNLDGNKIFFGNLTLWSFLAAICLAALALAIVII